MSEQLSVVEWARERYENSERIAAQKTGTDRDGWLEDVAYWRAIVSVLSSLQAAQPTLASMAIRYDMKSAEERHPGVAAGFKLMAQAVRAALLPTEKETT
jgi:hypothetical protein